MSSYNAHSLLPASNTICLHVKIIFLHFFILTATQRLEMNFSSLTITSNLQQQQHHISIHAHGSSCAQREKQWVKLLFIQSSVILSCIQFFMINVLLYILWSSINITLNGVSLRGKDCYDLSLSPNVCSVRSSWIKNETFMRTIIKWASFNEEKMLWLSEAKTS